MYFQTEKEIVYLQEVCFICEDIESRKLNSTGAAAP